jgi:hypothetical protein
VNPRFVEVRVWVVLAGSKLAAEAEEADAMEATATTKSRRLFLDNLIM